MIKHLFKIAVCISLMHVHSGFALQQQDLPPFLEADSLVQAAVEESNLPGAVLHVAQDGDVLFHQAYGHAKRYAFGGTELSTPEPMTTSHRFDLASLTKVFATTFGIMMLVDAGEITLDDPVHHHLPLFTGPSKDSVTVRHLLSHTSGLYPWKPLYYHASSSEETYAYISKLELATPVGRERHYSDLGFMLLGYLVEEVSGQSLDAFMHTRLYNRLGLQHTGFIPEQGPFAATSHGNPFEKRMVADDDFGYVCDEDPEAFTGWRSYVLQGEVNDGNAYHANEGEAGHAGLFSTAEELNTLLSMLLNDGVHEEQQIISQEVIAEFLTPTETGHGLGWAMAAPALPVESAPVGTFGHTGFTGTFAVGVPESGVSIVLLTNRQQTNVGPDGRYMSLTGLRKSVVSAILQVITKNRTHEISTRYLELELSTQYDELIDIYAPDARFFDPTAEVFTGPVSEGVVTGADAIISMQKDWGLAESTYDISASFTVGEYALYRGTLKTRFTGGAAWSAFPFVTIHRIQDGQLTERLDFGEYIQSFNMGNQFDEATAQTKEVADLYLRGYLEADLDTQSILAADDIQFQDPMAHIFSASRGELKQGKTALFSERNRLYRTVRRIEFDIDTSFAANHHAVYMGELHYIMNDGTSKHYSAVIAIEVREGKVTRQWDFVGSAN